MNLNLDLFELLNPNVFFNFDAKPRLEQASHWEVTKHHLQAAKHNISSESLTPSGHHHDGEEGVDEGEDGDEGDEDNENEDDEDERMKGKRIMHPWMLTLPYFQRPALQVWT